MRDWYSYPTRDEFLERASVFLFEDPICPRCHVSTDKLIEDEEEGEVCEACIGELRRKER